MRVRDVITTAIEISGIALVAFGAWLLLPAVGVIVAGLGLVLIGARTT